MGIVSGIEYRRFAGPVRAMVRHVFRSDRVIGLTPGHNAHHQFLGNELSLAKICGNPSVGFALSLEASFRCNGKLI